MRIGGRNPSAKARASRRRLLLALAAGALVPSASWAAGSKSLAIVSIGGDGTEKMFGPIIAALASRGYRRGENLTITMLVRDGLATTGPSNDDLARQAVALKPDAILTISTQTTEALRRQTRTIPIVTSLADPVGMGFAQSEARPGGNVTGVSQGFSVGAVKGVEAIRSMVPGLKRLAVFHGDGPVSVNLARELEKAASAQGIATMGFKIADDASARKAFGEIAKANVQAGCWLTSGADPKLGAEEAIRRRLPLVTIGSDTADLGMLASFRTSFPDFQDRLAAIVARVLSGENPATIPFELPREFDIAINRRTAQALGLTMPADVLLRAKRVVD